MSNGRYIGNDEGELRSENAGNSRLAIAFGLAGAVFGAVTHAGSLALLGTTLATAGAALPAVDGFLSRHFNRPKESARRVRGPSRYGYLLPEYV